MKFTHVIAAALAVLTALPAHAQSEGPIVADTYDSGDWWWIDVSGEGPGGAILLVNGEGIRRGDLVELRAFLLYREPDAKGAVGTRVMSVVDCAGKTDTATFDALFFPDMRMQRAKPFTRPAKALDPRTIYYRFACSDDRSHATHFGSGSRRSITADIFAKYPPKH